VRPLAASPQRREPLAASPTSASRVGTRPKGAVILGGAHGTLALARSLAAQGVEVWLVSNDNPLPSWSRTIHRALAWPGPDDPAAAAFLLSAADRHGLRGFLLVPGADSDVRFVSQNADILRDAYRIRLPDWDRLRWVCEKPLLYRRAEELEISVPKTYRFGSTREAAEALISFPIVLKPNMGGGLSHLARAKVIRVDDRATFLELFEEATSEIGPENIVVQELIPGGGECQFSYAALWHEGAPVAEFAARRTRQYPVEFGYTSTYVETFDEPQVITAARRILGSIEHDGLVEVEFKRDRRDGSLKLLDVNPRPWSWFGLAAAAGVDLGAMICATEAGLPVTPAAAPAGFAWMYLARDSAAAFKLLLSGRLALGAYLRSFAKVRAWAVFSLADPVPGLLDIPLTGWRVLIRRVLKLR